MKLLATVAIGSALALSACSPASPHATVVVAAPSSMLDVMPALVAGFEESHPGITVSVTTAGSATNVQQVINGAPIDVLITADEAAMDVAVSATTVGAPRPIATNSPAIAVAVGNRGSVNGIEDFARAELVLVQCAPEQPCGRMATQLFASHGVIPSIDSYEPNAAAALVKVSTGEADATITYASLLHDRADVEAIPIPGADSASVTLMAATVLAPPGAQTEVLNPAQLFLDFLLSDSARSILSEAGFGLIDGGGTP